MVALHGGSKVLKARHALLAAVLAGTLTPAIFAANPPAASTPIFNEKEEFDHEVSMAGRIADGLRVSLVADYESTNRNVPGLGNLDGLPLPVMRPRTKKEVQQ